MLLILGNGIVADLFELDEKKLLLIRCTSGEDKFHQF